MKTKEFLPWLRILARRRELKLREVDDMNKQFDLIRGIPSEEWDDISIEKI